MKKSSNHLVRVVFLFLLIAFTAIQAEAASFIPQSTVKAVSTALVKKHGEVQAARIERCVPLTASFWRAEDGDAKAFENFCMNNFTADPSLLEAVFGRYEKNFESIEGHYLAIHRAVMWPIDVDEGEILPVDRLFADYSPHAHMDDDFFRTKIAFMALLNFPQFTLEEKLRQSATWSRDEWARVRLGDIFAARVPAAVRQRVNTAYLAADDYINSYNIYMHSLLDAEGSRPFPEGLRLISHWGLRDELKALYKEPTGLPKQNMIACVMERIIRQEIPGITINNPKVDWNPEKNTVASNGKLIPAVREPDTRYRRLLGVFRAERKLDPYYPQFPSMIARKFNREREIPEKQMEQLLVSVLSSPTLKEVGKLIEKRLGRPLQPFDIWYTGFDTGKALDQNDLDKMVRDRYPNVQAFQKDLPNILMKLGFSGETAEFLSGKIQVDPARGAGHAMGAEMRGDKAHLRTRFGKNGMDYQGFNVACHELGHCVEQTFSLYRVDHTLLQGVPNTAFTEAFAFIFQSKDMAVLGLPQEKDAVKEQLAVLNNLWLTYEISGVGLLDMRIWRWMYAHPGATPKELKEAVLSLAKGVWNTYFAPVIGVKDSVLLAVYSHIIDAGLYTPDYPLGHIIQFQLESYLADKNLASEMERMCVQGMLTPNAWMKGAVGYGISSEPLLKAAEEALKELR
ncbi:MAG: hypothetical protein V2A78_03990 [bacterium]